MVREPGSSGRILLVEDDHAYQEIFSFQMARHGFQTHSIDSLGRIDDAVASYTPGLIVCDQNLPPIKDPFEVISKLRQFRVPSIILTGQQNDRVADQIRESGSPIMDYIIKPMESTGYMGLALACAREMLAKYRPCQTGRIYTKDIFQEVPSHAPRSQGWLRHFDPNQLEEKLIRHPYKIIDGIYILTPDRRNLQAYMALHEFERKGYPVIPITTPREIEKNAGVVHPAVIIYDERYDLSKAQTHMLETLFPYAAALQLGRYKGLRDVRMVNAEVRARLEDNRKLEDTLNNLLMYRELKIQQLWQHQPGHYVLFGAHASGKTRTTQNFISSHPLPGFNPSATSRAPRPGERHGVDKFFFEKSQLEDMSDSQTIIKYTHGDTLYGLLFEPAFETLLDKLDLVHNVKNAFAMTLLSERLNPDTRLCSPKKIYVFREEDEMLLAARRRDKVALDESAQRTNLQLFDALSHQFDLFVYNFTPSAQVGPAGSNAPAMEFLGSLPLLASATVGAFIRKEREKAPVRPGGTI